MISRHAPLRASMCRLASLARTLSSQSLIPIAGLIFAFGEHSVLLQQPALGDPVFLFVSFLGGLIGFAISFSSLWFLSLVGVHHRNYPTGYRRHCAVLEVMMHRYPFPIAT